MHRIDTPTAQPDKFGPGKNGFTGGNPQTGQLPTALDQDFFDALQEEIAHVVEGAGLELDKQDHGQMLIALGMLFAEKDATITALSGLDTSANKLAYFTGNDKAALTDLTATGRGIIGQNDITDVLSFLGLEEIPGRLLNVKLFTSSGTYTPSPGTKKIIVECLGAGGGGGGAQAANGFASFGAGGAAGSYGKGIFDVLLSSYQVTIGSGGDGGGGTSNGAAGGNTSLGSLISASGGNPGQTALAGTEPYIMGSLGAPGTVSGGNVISNPAQNTGGFGFRLSSTVCSGGTGADSIYGRGGDAASSTNRAGGSASGYGAGGGGGRAMNQSGTPFVGGDGSDGLVIIWEYA